MFLHVLEVFLVCFPRSACRERSMRDHGSISNGSFSNGSKGFFWHIGFFGGVRQRVSRTISIIDMRDGLTKWFLEGTEESVVRRNV